MISRTEPKLHELVFRVPGRWKTVEEFAELLPDDYRLEGEQMVGPLGISVEFQQVAADTMFPAVFAQACLRPPREDEQEVLSGYQTNSILLAQAGSQWSAARMMEFGAAAVKAGGAGVFIDNSARAHGAADWLQLLEAVRRDDIEALLWAFVSIVSGKTDIYSIGAHVLGQADGILRRTDDLERDAETLKCFILKAMSGLEPREEEVVDGPHRIRLRQERSQHFPATFPMYNPFGQWRLQVID